jgi:hypothetical protein
MEGAAEGGGLGYLLDPPSRRLFLFGDGYDDGGGTDDVHLRTQRAVPATWLGGEGGKCFDAMNFAFSVRLGGVDYDVGLSNLIVAGFLFLGPLFVFIMALRGFRAARRALFKKSPTLSPTTISHPPHTANKLVRQVPSTKSPKINHSSINLMRFLILFLYYYY